MKKIKKNNFTLIARWMIDFAWRNESISQSDIAIFFNKDSDTGQESNTSRELASGHSVKTYSNSKLKN